MIRFVLLSFLSAGLLLGCDDPKPKPPTSKRPGAGRRRGRRPPPRRPPNAAAAVHRKAKPLELAEPDFLASPTNRDPFKSYLGEFITPQRRVAKLQRNVKLQRYALDELRLIAVVTGQTRARAMFRDPKGLGVAVKRGDYISKSGGRVKQILPGKVVVEIQEQLEGGQKMADRVIDLHPKGEKKGF